MSLQHSTEQQSPLGLCRVTAADTCIRADQRRPARSGFAPKAGEDLRLHRGVRYQGTDFTQQQFTAVQCRRQKQPSRKDGKLHQKEQHQNDCRGQGIAVGKGKTGSATVTAKKDQGRAKAKQGTVEKAAGSSDDNVCPEAHSKGTRAAPDRAASKGKPEYAERDDDLDYECDCRSTSDLGWSRKTRVMISKYYMSFP